MSHTHKPHMKHRLTQLPVMNLKGKSYSEVKDRIRFVAESYDYDVKILGSEFIAAINEWKCIVQVSIYFEGKDNAPSIYDGIASEPNKGRGANQTHALENCYTSAVGTALGKAAIGLPAHGLASFDEVQNAISRQDKAQKDFETEKKNLDKRYQSMDWDKYQELLDQHYDLSIEQVDKLAELWVKLYDIQKTVDKAFEAESKNTAA
jgi:hypothetical protein